MAFGKFMAFETFLFLPLRSCSVSSLLALYNSRAPRSMPYTLETVYASDLWCCCAPGSSAAVPRAPACCCACACFQHGGCHGSCTSIELALVCSGVQVAEAVRVTSCLLRRSGGGSRKLLRWGWPSPIAGPVVRVCVAVAAGAPRPRYLDGGPEGGGAGQRHERGPAARCRCDGAAGAPPKMPQGQQGSQTSPARLARLMVARPQAPQSIAAERQSSAATLSPTVAVVRQRRSPPTPAPAGAGAREVHRREGRGCLHQERIRFQAQPHLALHRGQELWCVAA